MPSSECNIPNGWLRKACRFGIMQQLKLRYFVLVNTELRYYKYPDDLYPAGTIELKNMSSVQIYHNTGSLYGFKLVPKTKGVWKPVLYTNSEEERERWIRQLRNKINQLCSTYRVATVEEEYDGDDPNNSVLDKWLYKLNLHDASTSRRNTPPPFYSSRDCCSVCLMPQRPECMHTNRSNINTKKNVSFDSIDYSSDASSTTSSLPSSSSSSSLGKVISIESAQKMYTEITRLYQHRFTSGNTSSRDSLSSLSSSSS